MSSGHCSHSQRRASIDASGAQACRWGQNRDRRYGCRFDLGGRGRRAVRHIADRWRFPRFVKRNYPGQVVGRDGGTACPLPDECRWRGARRLKSRNEIEHRLAEQAIEPQVIVTITRSRSSTAPESHSRSRAIAFSTSSPSPAARKLPSTTPLSAFPYVTVTCRWRGSSPTRLRTSTGPGDVLTLVQVPQTFSVLGATRQNVQITFNAKQINLVEALAKAGGLQDLR
jgi:polysaccharide export outer membrane protein